jgi:hypothetical protein
MGRLPSEALTTGDRAGGSWEGDGGQLGGDGRGGGLGRAANQPAVCPLSGLGARPVPYLSSLPCAMHVQASPARTTSRC